MIRQANAQTMTSSVCAIINDTAVAASTAIKRDLGGALQSGPAGSPHSPNGHHGMAIMLTTLTSDPTRN